MGDRSHHQDRLEQLKIKKARLQALKESREHRNARTSNIQPILSGQSSPQQKSAFDVDAILEEVSARPASTGAYGIDPGSRVPRPLSTSSVGRISVTNSDQGAQAGEQVREPPSLVTVPLTTVYECPPSPVKEVFNYSKGVQTTEDWTEPARPRAASVASEIEESVTATPSKRLSRRERDREEELRERIRKEIEEELKATKGLVEDGIIPETGNANYPLRHLTSEEVAAVTASDEFRDFVDKSTKVIERALDQDSYDILTDYALHGLEAKESDEESGNTAGKGRHRVKEIGQYADDVNSRKRMVSSLDFSPKFPELFLSSHTRRANMTHESAGVVQIWNLHMHDRAEYVFTAQSDVLTAKFSPFHPNLVVGGCYSGQILLWDTRAKSAPVSRTPITGNCHTHPVYALDIVGTQNAHNIISASTDGKVCAWNMDIFAEPAESMILKHPAPAKIDEVAPTSLSFPDSDPTFFLAGTEEGVIFPCHRYDRANAKMGIEPKLSYRGHTAPVMSVAFHPARGPIDLGDLVISSSLDWSVKLWKVRPPAANSTGGSAEGTVAPLLDFTREDIIYDAKWSPIKPSVFALADGAGYLELWDIAEETEEPVARIKPTKPEDWVSDAISRSLNRVAWEPTEGKRLAVGGLDGKVTVFEVGPGLGGREELKAEEWTTVKKLVNRMDTIGANGDIAV